MKKIFYPVLFLLLVNYSTGFSQGAPAPHFGVKGGINFANVGGESNPFTVDFVGGVYGEYFFNYFWEMQVELLLSGQGHGSELDNGDGKLNLTYLNIPVLAGYSPNYNMTFHLGPQFGFLLGANTIFLDEKQDIKEFLKAFDMGLALGGSYFFLEKRLGVTLRYIHGITNFNDSSGGNRFNRTIQVTASWRLVVVD